MSDHFLSLISSLSFLFKPPIMWSINQDQSRFITVYLLHNDFYLSIYDSMTFIYQRTSLRFLWTPVLLSSLNDIDELFRITGTLKWRINGIYPQGLIKLISLTSILLLCYCLSENNLCTSLTGIITV